ncbi:MAG: metallophosphoesterase [Hyphomicrobium sp.]
MTSSSLSSFAVERLTKNPDQRGLQAPFDLIGDVHGCALELQDLLNCLGTKVEIVGKGKKRQAHLLSWSGRKIIFVGDLVDRGPATPDVLRIVIALTRAGYAQAVVGNHDIKFVRFLEGHSLSISHGLEQSVEQMRYESEDFHAEVCMFLKSLPYHLWLDGGALAVAHAGIKENMLGSTTSETHKFCLYGETSGEQDEFGLPVRYHWAAEYRGCTAIVYGHTPVAEPDWVHETLCIDTGCCFGGCLTGLRWPEREIVSVPARQTYAHKRRPFGHPPLRPLSLLSKG